MIDLQNQYTRLRLHTGCTKIIENFCVVYQTKLADEKRYYIGKEK